MPTKEDGNAAANAVGSTQQANVVGAAGEHWMNRSSCWMKCLLDT
jgi:hypothetical protein